MTKPVIYVIIYSTWGHIKTMADHVVKGIEASGLAEVKLFQVPETLPENVLTMMHAAKFDIPVITVEDLKKADGFIFGIPTRYGCPAPQVSFSD